MRQTAAWRLICKMSSGVTCMDEGGIMLFAEDWDLNGDLAVILLPVPGLKYLHPTFCLSVTP